MTRRTMVRLICLLWLLLLSRPLDARDWPQWRGPNRDGIVTKFKPPAIWPDQLKMKWSVSVGEGHASPVVVGNRVYLHSRQDDQETIACFDLRSGKRLWTDRYAAPYKPDEAAVKHGKGPHSTPVVANGKLYTLGMTGILSSYDIATGKRNWRKEFSQQFKTTSPEYGTSTSPVVDSGLLITYLGGKDDGALIAYDAKTGKEKWRWAGDGPGYCSPIVAELSGVRQVVVLSQQHIISVALASGELLWQIPFKTEWNNSIVTPVMYKDMLIFSAVDKETLAVKPIRHDGKWAIETVWRNDQLDMYMSSPVLKGDYLFGMTHKRKGQFFCLDARTGVARWTSEGREGDNAAILGAGALLFLLTDDGELMIARANAEQYAVVKKYTVAQSPTWAQPVILNNIVLIKDASTLACWQIEIGREAEPFLKSLESPR
jgi:outer membrane protein assembly factor BamB